MFIDKINKDMSLIKKRGKMFYFDLSRMKELQVEKEIKL